MTEVEKCVEFLKTHSFYRVILDADVAAQFVKDIMATGPYVVQCTHNNTEVTTVDVLKSEKRKCTCNNGACNGK